jgi:hypothetical protein
MHTSKFNSQCLKHESQVTTKHLLILLTHNRKKKANGNVSVHDEAETKRIYHQTFIVNIATVILSLAFVIGARVADAVFVSPYVHLAANVGLSGSRLVGHSSTCFGLASLAVAAVGGLLCYPLRHTRDPQDADQLRRCSRVHTAAAVAVVATLVAALIGVCVSLTRVAASQVRAEHVVDRFSCHGVQQMHIHSCVQTMKIYTTLLGLQFYLISY